MVADSNILFPNYLRRTVIQIDGQDYFNTVISN